VISDLQGAKVFKVGDDPEKQAYVVSKAGNGNWAGLKTIGVET
jgi:Nuclease A inhibitor-like protein